MYKFHKYEMLYFRNMELSQIVYTTVKPVLRDHIKQDIFLALYEGDPRSNVNTSVVSSTLSISNKSCRMTA